MSAEIRTHAANQAYRDGWDRVFGKACETCDGKGEYFSGELLNKGAHCYCDCAKGLELKERDSRNETRRLRGPDVHQP